MDLETLRETIAAMKDEGLNNGQIARKLKRQGVKSLRGAKPPTATMVGYHVRAMDKAKEVDAAPKPTPTTKSKSPKLEKIELAQRVLATDLPAKDKIDLVESLLSQ